MLTELQQYILDVPKIKEIADRAPGTVAEYVDYMNFTSFIFSGKTPKPSRGLLRRR